jgi:hypothetical protein
VPTPSPESFAALARSSPWLWSTLRFTERRRLPGGTRELRAWLRRPDQVRVETLDGALLQIVRESPRRVGVLTPDGGYVRELPWPATGELPLRRPDGLVAERPAGMSYDAPMYQDYRWVAMLDPVELADGIDPETGAAVPGLVIDEVIEVEHAGRPAWEAAVRTTPAYAPRCGCCPLLRSREVDLLEYGAESPWLSTTYPEAHRVRLDVGTGVCVLTSQVGGSTPAAGHDLRIEAVDEPMPDSLFVPAGHDPGTRPPRRGRSRR